MHTKIETAKQISGSVNEIQEQKEYPHSLLRAVKYITFGLIIAGICLVVFLQARRWLVQSPWFLLKKISVEGNYMLSQRELASAITLPEKPHLMTLPLEEIRGGIMANPWLREVTLNRVFPSTLKITVEERVPAAFILGEVNMLVDSEGYLLPQPEKTKAYDFPCITGIKNLETQTEGKSDNAELLAALAMLEKLRELDTGLWFKISEICWEEGTSFKIYLYEDAIPIRIPKEGRLRERLYILNHFLNYIASNNRFDEIALIDLTYEGQLITKMRN